MTKALLQQARDALKLLRDKHWAYWSSEHKLIVEKSLAALDANLAKPSVLFTEEQIKAMLAYAVLQERERYATKEKPND